MLTCLRKRLHGEEGFTLIELLVVILIIGILAAIAIPAFLNQKGKGEDAGAKASAREAATAMETYYTDNNDYQCGSAAAATINGTAYLAGCDSALHAIENTLPTWGTGLGQMQVTPGASTYSIVVSSNPSGRTFTITKNGGTVTRTCAKAAAGDTNGGCKISGNGTTGTW